MKELLENYINDKYGYGSEEALLAEKYLSYKQEVGSFGIVVFSIQIGNEDKFKSNYIQITLEDLLVFIYKK